jgi:hypothetical protein
LTIAVVLMRSLPPMVGSKGQFLHIKARQREQDYAWAEDQRRRDADPLEQAKRFLRSRGYIIAPESNPDFWSCGRRSGLEDADLVALASRLGCPFERTIHETREADSRRSGPG